MLIKISSDDPTLEQAINLLKYRTSANSKAAKKPYTISTKW